ncbi:MAG: hypothetical protein MJY83_02985 [Bacteroidales bacterium]|nr:hypothetical protein [Bacteroidales bacterium]
MKALIIIASCIAFAFLFRVVEYFTSKEGIKSVGAKANRNYKDMAKLDINNEEELKKALEAYKDLID